MELGGEEGRSPPSVIDARAMHDELKAAIRSVPDFPKPGIIFKDITPVLANGPLYAKVIDAFAERYRGKIDRVIAMESRGFLFGAPLATTLGVGLAIARKPGKLPWKTHQVRYALEYGHDILETHVDAIEKGSRVLVIDDLLATGGTALAAAQLVERQGGEVIELAFVIELGFLPGRQKLAPRPVYSMLQC